jgi:hypothetical protein
MSDHILAKTPAPRQHFDVNAVPSQSRRNIRLVGNIGIPSRVFLAFALMRNGNGDIR